jgi:type IV secretion system protein VirB9
VRVSSALLFALVAQALAAPPLAAQTYPQPGLGDPHIQTVQYDPAQIIRLSVAPGLQTMVELAPGENIQTIAVGDSAAWQVSAGKRGDIFFVKNIGAAAMTNMSVVTASRVYNFELMPPNGYGGVSAYQVKVTYPARVQETALTAAEQTFEYHLSGSKTIRPSDVYQEGARTIVEWPENAALPAIFVLEDGNETLVNGEMQEGRFVIPGTPAKLVFRIDRKIAYAKRKALKGGVR